MKRLAASGLGFLFARGALAKEGFGMPAEKLMLSYGSNPLAIDSPEGLLEIIKPNPYPSLSDPIAAIIQALTHPIGSPPLADRIKQGNKVAIAISDSTRNFPQKMMVEQLLLYLRDQARVDARNISFIVGNGNHAEKPLETLQLGDAIIRQYPFINFNSTRMSAMKYLGRTKPADPDFFGRATARAWTEGLSHTGESIFDGVKSLFSLDLAGIARSVHGGPLVETGLAWFASRGTPIWLDQSACDADIVIGIGQIKPHPLTGFSGGVKAIVPAIGARRSTITNHLLQAHPSVGVGNVNHNILRLDLENACALLPNVFILNVVTNGAKEPAAFVAGDPIAAHRAGVAIAEKICRVASKKADIVIYSNKAQGKTDLYQFIKSLAVAQAIVKPGGVLIAVADLPEGTGTKMKINPSMAVNEVYYHYNYRYRMPAGVDTMLVCSNSQSVCRGTFLIPSPSVEKALAWAKSKVGPNATVSVVPDTDMILAR